jgi:hypothetical protein
VLLARRGRVGQPDLKVLPVLPGVREQRELRE